MKPANEEEREFGHIAAANAKLLFDGARALRASGVDEDECTLSAAMLLIAYSYLNGFTLEETQKLVAANWAEGTRQMAARGHRNGNRMRRGGRS